MSRKAVFFIILWIAAAVAAFVFRRELGESPVGIGVLVVLFLPLVLLAWVVAEGLGDGVIQVLIWIAFKVVTLGLVQTELESAPARPLRFGFHRDWDGPLVASHGVVTLIGLAVWAIVAVTSFVVFS